MINGPDYKDTDVKPLNIKEGFLKMMMFSQKLYLLSN